MTDKPAFDPSRYLTKVGNADYLEVKWRLVWLREVHPEASLDTELVSHTGQLAIFKATIAIPGGGSASGYGSEQEGDFRDYIEKAETKAIGRALAALGFGTQFTKDFEFGADQGRVVDSPVGGTQQSSRTYQSGPRTANGPSASNPQAATPRQLGFIKAIATERGWTDEQLDVQAEQLYGTTVDALSRRDASALIERLRSMRIETTVSSS